jgi:hypothetical protein
MSGVPEMPDSWKRGVETAATGAELVALKKAEVMRDGMKHFAEAEKAKTQRATGNPIERLAKPDEIVLEVAMKRDAAITLEYLIDPWLPKNQVVGFYGKGGTSKSSFVATLAGTLSDHATTLWISTEEDPSWIKVRHIKICGNEGTLFVFKAIVTQVDAQGRALASMFNVYEHLDAAITAAKSQAQAIHNPERPLRLVVLDTAVALTTWGKGESPNDDRAVKRLFTYLLSLCDKHDLSIAVIGHINKGRHEHAADQVAGAGAWTSSTRQSFLHLYDKREAYSYVVRTVKDTLTGPFAAAYTTQPVHTLARRPDGSDSVLCRVQVQAPLWGHRNLEALVDAATGQEDGAAGTGGGKRESQVLAIVTTVLRLLDQGVAPVTRKLVHESMGREANRRHWQEADSVLAVGHSVRVTSGPHNVAMYVRQQV